MTERTAMTEDRCPFGANCPHVQTVRNEVEKLDTELGSLRSLLLKMNTTLYFIAGVLSIHLGIMIL